MQTLQFTNGDQMPMLGLGTWKSRPGEVYDAVKTALRLGYRHIDCAAIYGNETEVGNALAEICNEGVVGRDRLWITSKLWNSAHAPDDARPALEKTLADLQLDYLDLYLMHWPVAMRPGALLPESAADMASLEDYPLAETWRAMEELVTAGLCRHIGLSNFSIPKLRGLLENSRVRPEMNQIELHPYLQQPEMLAFCGEEGIHLTAYSPLGSPDRPSMLKAKDEPVLLADPVITAIAARHDTTPAQVLISWALHRGTAVIPKSVNPSRIAENLTAVEIALDSSELAEIASLDRARRYVDGRFWTMPGSPYTLENLWDEPGRPT